MAGEFFNKDACTSACQSRIVQKNREREKKERELAIQKQRREQRKREKEAKEALERQKEQQEMERLHKQQMQAQLKQNRDLLQEESDDDEDENAAETSTRLPYDSPHAWLDVVKCFSWSRYLVCTNSRAAPSKMFHEAYPTAPNSFKVGMKLEAIDPEHPALICVATIGQVQGMTSDHQSSTTCFSSLNLKF